MQADAPAITSYVTALDRVLTGPSRVRRDLVAEAHDHLVDASEAYLRAGWDPSSAAEHAVRDFGTLDRVAPDYQAVLGVAASRRCSLTLFALLLPQAFLWDNGLRLIPPAVDPVELVAVLQATIKWLGFGALLIALATVVIAGVGQRWIPVGPWLPRWAGRSVALGAMGSVVLGVTLLAMNGGGSPTVWTQMVTLLVAPMLWTMHSARLCCRAADTDTDTDGPVSPVAAPC